MDNGWADASHEVEVRAAGQTRVIPLPDLPGNDYKLHKGDLWKLEFSRDFKFTRCVTLNNTVDVAIEAGSDDGWNIDSIVTYVGVDGRFMELTHDFNVRRWIDSDGLLSYRRRVPEVPEISSTGKPIWIASENHDVSMYCTFYVRHNTCTLLSHLLRLASTACSYLPSLLDWRMDGLTTHIKSR